MSLLNKKPSTPAASFRKTHAEADSRSRRNFIRKPIAAACSLLILSGCVSIDHNSLGDDQAPIVEGPLVSSNSTPLEGAFQCMNRTINDHGRRGLALTVGNVKDYTGKFSELDGGNPITQGGALMVISALGKLGDSIQLRERFDTQVTEIELAYLNKRYLGDGGSHQVRQNGNGVTEVPWLPYTGGTIIKSDYYIVGGISELNYNIQTGGAELFIKGTGGKGRIFVINVAVDLRIVNTTTLNVANAGSLQKQLVGYEVGASIFRFFDDLLVDFNAGVKSQEPMQLGVRTALELGVIELVGYVTGVDHKACLTGYFGGTADQATQMHDEGRDNVVEQATQSSHETAAAAAPAPAPAEPAQTSTPIATSDAQEAVAQTTVVYDAMTEPLQPLEGQIIAVGARGRVTPYDRMLGDEVEELIAGISVPDGTPSADASTPGPLSLNDTQFWSDNIDATTER